jgi:hypothetical protein
MLPHRIPAPPILIMSARNPNCAVICAASASSRIADRYFPSYFLNFFLFCRCRMRCAVRCSSCSTACFDCALDGRVQLVVRLAPLPAAFPCRSNRLDILSLRTGGRYRQLRESPFSRRRRRRTAWQNKREVEVLYVIRAMDTALLLLRLFSFLD